MLTPLDRAERHPGDAGLPGEIVLGDPAGSSRCSELVSRSDGYLHFYGTPPHRRREVAAAVRDLGFEMVVVAWRGAGLAAQARPSCLKIAARRLHGVADELVLETANPKSDARDARGLSRMHPTSYRLPVRFETKTSEPLTWGPDIVAGAAQQAFRHGDRTYLNALGEVEILDAP